MRTALEAVLTRVADRGGPAAPWSADLVKRRAMLCDMTITFYALPNGEFSLQSYSCRDKRLDRDRDLLEDGYASIAVAVANAERA